MNEQNRESRDIVYNCGSCGIGWEAAKHFHRLCFGAEFVYNYGYRHLRHMNVKKVLSIWWEEKIQYM